MRNGTWRSHVLRPERPCLVCNKQLDPATIQLDRQGVLDDPYYIAGAGRAARLGHENVALLSPSVSAALHAQFVSLVAAPGASPSRARCATPCRRTPSNISATRRRRVATSSSRSPPVTVDPG
jgi:hypothetical protein